MEKKIMALVLVSVVLLASMAFPQALVDAVRRLPPIVTTLNRKTVQIGVIWPTSGDQQLFTPYYTDIIKPDINDYCQKLGYSVSFDFVFMNAGKIDQYGNENGDAQTHLLRVQQLKKMGVDLFIGGPWSGMAQASLAYVNANNMVMFSKSSTSPNIAIAGDNLFRMCPTDGELAPALVEMLWSYGIKSIVIVQRGDYWGDGLVNTFKPLWEAKGGGFTGDTIRYEGVD